MSVNEVLLVFWRHAEQHYRSPEGKPTSQLAEYRLTIRAVRVPNSFIMATNFSFDGVTPFADAYQPRASDAPDALDNVIVDAPQGSTVPGEVY